MASPLGVIGRPHVIDEGLNYITVETTVAIGRVVLKRVSILHLTLSKVDCEVSEMFVDEDREVQQPVLK